MNEEKKALSHTQNNTAHEEKKRMRSIFFLTHVAFTQLSNLFYNALHVKRAWNMLSAAMINKWFSFRIDRGVPRVSPIF